MKRFIAVTMLVVALGLSACGGPVRVELVPTTTTVPTTVAPLPTTTVLSESFDKADGEWTFTLAASDANGPIGTTAEEQPGSLNLQLVLTFPDGSSSTWLGGGYSSCSMWVEAGYLPTGGSCDLAREGTAPVTAGAGTPTVTATALFYADGQDAASTSKPITFPLPCIDEC